MHQLSCFREIWAVDFEFQQPSGERPVPVCMVGRELRSGRLVRLWGDELHCRSEPPYSTGHDSLFVAYYGSAELGCHLALNWPMPTRILDLFAEFKCRTCGVTTPNGAGLLGAMSFFGLDGITGCEKDSMRQLVMRGGRYSHDERLAILDYCQSDVDALAQLLPQMAPGIDLPRALVRGRYMAAAARMEWNGVPIDVESLGRFRANWDTIQSRLIERIDRDYGIYEGRTFKANRWASWLETKGIPWPRLDSGALALDDDTFRSMSRSHPDVAPIRELRNSLSKLRLHDLAVGKDGRNRCLLSAFGSKTGRNQPSNSKFIFGPSAWLRSLIKPQPGHALAYVDYSQQEFGIGAALAHDRAMQDAYSCGDPYLQFAIQAGAAPPDATKQTHAAVREQFKTCALAVQYSMSAESLGQKLNVPTVRGRELISPAPNDLLGLLEMV
jgi:DNA polymerase family A